MLLANLVLSGYRTNTPEGDHGAGDRPPMLPQTAEALFRTTAMIQRNTANGWQPESIAASESYQVGL
jgi:hypothetical protein